MLYCHVDLIIYYLYRGRAVTRFTNLQPDPFAIYFVKLIYFNVNTYMGQYNMLKGKGHSIFFHEQLLCYTIWYQQCTNQCTSSSIYNCPDRRLFFVCFVLVLMIFNKWAYFTSSQSSITPSIYGSQIVKTRLNPFLELTSTQQ